MVQKLRARAMPPPGMPRPDQATYDSFATYLERELGGPAAAESHPGSPPIHRLNRAEYTNTIRDLLAVDFDGESYLPADDEGEGFDNLAAVLSVSPVLMERYMSAAVKISRMAIGDPSSRPIIEIYEVSESLLQDSRLNDDLPLGSRGGIAIRHHFPVDGQYLLNIRLRRTLGQTNRGVIRGLLDDQPHQLDVFLDSARIKQFSVGGERHGATGILHQREGQQFGGDPEQQYYEMEGAEEDLEVRFSVKAGTRLVGVTFLKQTLEPEGMLESGPRPMLSDTLKYKGGDPALHSVLISGPYTVQGVGDTPSRRRIFVCHPNSNDDEESCARKILSTLARRAYRRPVTDEDVQPLLSLYGAGSERGFEAGIELALQGILAGPEFSIPHGTRSGECAVGYRLSCQRLGTGFPVVFFSLEQHSRQPAFRPGRARSAQRSCSAGTAGSPYAGPSALGRSGGQFRGTVAVFGEMCATGSRLGESSPISTVSCVRHWSRRQGFSSKTCCVRIAACWTSWMQTIRS